MSDSLTEDQLKQMLQQQLGAGIAELTIVQRGGSSRDQGRITESYKVHEHGEISDTQGEIATVGKTRTPVQGNPVFSNGVVSTKQILECVSKTENFGSTSKNME